MGWHEDYPKDISSCEMKLTSKIYFKMGQESEREKLLALLESRCLVVCKGSRKGAL
jgi:hypothetical protein